MPKYTFYGTAYWTSGRRGLVQAEIPGKSIVFSAPREFQGEPGFWSPEDFLVAAVGSCFVTTFRAIAEASKFEYVSLEVAVEGAVEKGDSGFQFTELVLKPQLTIQTEPDRPRGERLLEKTEHACLISRSLKSRVRMEPKIEAAEPQRAEGGEIHMAESMT